MKAIVQLKYFERSDWPTSRPPRTESVEDIANSLNADEWWEEHQGLFSQPSGFLFEVVMEHNKYFAFGIPEELLQKGLDLQEELDNRLVCYEVELSIIIYSNGNPGFSIEPEQLRKLMKLNAAIDVDIYLEE